MLRAEDSEKPAEAVGASSDSNVEYVGDAAKPGGKRPVLRLWGDELPLLPLAPAADHGAAKIKVVGEKTGAALRPAALTDDAPGVYRRLLAELQRGRFEEALAGFREYVRMWPRHDLADNAQYWMGECYYHRRLFEDAVREFRVVVERFPHGNKVPDALLKAGFSYLVLGSVEAGRQTLNELVRSYPDHYSAPLALARLREMTPGAAEAPEEPSAQAPTPSTQTNEGAPSGQQKP
jgi:tol-pal system protein YbgF